MCVCVCMYANVSSKTSNQSAIRLVRAALRGSGEIAANMLPDGMTESSKVSKLLALPFLLQTKRHPAFWIDLHLCLKHLLLF